MTVSYFLRFDQGGEGGKTWIFDVKKGANYRDDKLILKGCRGTNYRDGFILLAKKFTGGGCYAIKPQF